MNENDLHETELGSFHSGSIYSVQENDKRRDKAWDYFEVSSDNKRTFIVS